MPHCKIKQTRISMLLMLLAWCTTIVSADNENVCAGATVVGSTGSTQLDKTVD